MTSRSAEGRLVAFYGFAASVLVLVATTLIHALVLGDPDTFWHVKVGLDILSHQSFPRTDTYSYTFFGHPWIAKEWLGQVVLALSYLAAGWNGVVLGTALAYAATALLFYRALVRSLSPLIAASATLLAATLVSTTLLARPHVISFPFMILWADQLFLRARTRRPPPLWLLPVLVIWANIHAGFTLGYVIALFAFFDVAERTRLSDRGLIAKWIGFGILCPVVSVIHPYGVEAILATFNVAIGNAAVPFIGEWVPFNVASMPAHGMVIIALFVGLLVRPVRTSVSRAVFCGLVLYMFLSHVRFVYALFFLAPIALAPDVANSIPASALTSWLAERRDTFEAAISGGWRLIGGALAGFVMVYAVAFARVPQIIPPQDRSAAGGLAYVRAHEITGNVLNSYDFGGTLIFHGIKTFVDGRTDQLFLGKFWTTLRNSEQRDGQDALEKLLKDYKVSWALLTKDDPRIFFFERLTGWKRVYSDQSAVIFVSESVR